VLDFGIAKLAGVLRNSPKTSTGVIMGTPIYMSPEQCRGITDIIDHRSDIYSLGVILFHSVCGRPPFISDGVGEIMGMHMFGDLPKPSQFAPSIPPALEQVMLKALAREPDARYQTMASLQKDLRAAELVPEPEASLARKLPIDGSSAPVAAHSTTLSSFARESSARQEADVETQMVRKHPYRLLALLGGGVVAAGAVVAGLVLSGNPPHDPAELAPVVPVPSVHVPPTTLTAPAAPQAKIKISVVTTPEGANVTNAENGELLGVTPYTTTLPRGDGAMKIVVAKPGYQSQSHTVSFSRDEQLDLSLGKEPAKKERLRPKKEKIRVDPNAMRKL
jgi:serine/threonine protein kinase